MDTWSRNICGVFISLKCTKTFLNSAILEVVTATDIKGYGVVGVCRCVSFNDDFSC